MSDPRAEAPPNPTATHQDAALEARLLDAAPDAVVVVDVAGRIVLVNTQTEALFGYPREALLGQSMELLVPDRARVNHAAHREQYQMAPRVRPMGSGVELFGRRSDGSELPIEISLSPLHTPEGLLVSASIRDVSARKRSEHEMRRVQAQLLSAVESIESAFAIFDADDRLVLCNSTYRQLFGRDLNGSIVGRSFEALIEHAVSSRVIELAGAPPEATLARLFDNHRTPEAAVDVRGEGGKSYRVVERRTGDGGTVLTIADVTDEVEHEHALRRARAAAEEASAAKSEFLASMSHELRTPLNAILGFAQLLQRDKKTPLSDRHRERVDHVLKGGEHLLRLIDEVLDLARIEAGRVAVSPEPIGVGEVLMEVKATLDPMATRAEIDLVVEPLPQGFPQGFADRTRFKQVLMNFGSNAIKYGRRGGSARFRATVEGDAVRVTVQDDGLGIPEAEQSKIF
jgi:PAS domain S-box-containing protein